MFMDAFWLSLVMIFIAELGDKSQLLALTLATCYNSWVVIWGIFFSTLAVHVVSTALGWSMGGVLPADWIMFLVGISFIIYGFWTLRGDSLDDEEKSCRMTIHPFWLVFSTFFLAELGDKTMLGTVSLAAAHPFLPVWIGSTLGMVLSDALAIMVGKMLGKNLPETTIRIGAGALFLVFGAYTMYLGGVAFSPGIWVGGGVVILLAAVYFFRHLLPRTE